MLFSEVDGRIRERVRGMGSGNRDGSAGLGLRAVGIGKVGRGKVRVVLRSEEGKWLFNEA